MRQPSVDTRVTNMRIAGRILAHTLAEVAIAAKEGVTGIELDTLARTLIRRAGGEPAFLGYRPAGADHGFPATLCVSIDDVIVHGVPTKKPLKVGMLVKLDLGVVYRGYYADAAVTVTVGMPSPLAQRLTQTTKEALDAGIFAARAGATLGDIGHAISSVVKHQKFFVAHGLTGHGIGTQLHEDPNIFNEGKPGHGERLRVGMTVALEPMVCVGTSRIIRLPDESYATADKSLAAHFEHTILITDGEAEILTKL